MAFVRFIDGTEKTIKLEQAKKLWSVLNNEVEPTPEQQAFCDRVKHLYISWRKAPDSYLYANKQYIAPMVKDSWIVNSQGVPLRPDPTDKDCIRVSHALKLVD